MSKVTITVQGDHGSEEGSVDESTLDLLQDLGATVNGGRISIGLKKAADKLRIPESVLRTKLGLGPAKPKASKPAPEPKTPEKPRIAKAKQARAQESQKRFGTSSERERLSDFIKDQG